MFNKKRFISMFIVMVMLCIGIGNNILVSVVDIPHLFVIQPPEGLLEYQIQKVGNVYGSVYY